MRRLTASWGAALLASLVAQAFGAETPPAPATPAPTPGSTPASPADKPVVTFSVMEYRVQGNTVLPSRVIESVLYPLLGERRQMSDVEAARAALEKTYHDRGFGTVFVDIPPQEIEDGIVRLHVTEAKINEAKIEGAKYFSEKDVIAAIPAAKVGTVPNLTELQQQLATVNGQTPDRSVVPVLKAGPVPGTLDLDLKVADSSPFHGSLEMDDNYTADTKPLRMAGTLSYGNLFAELDSISVQYQVSPQDFNQVKVFEGSYSSRPLFGSDYRISGYYIKSNSNVSSVGAGTTGVLGDGQIAGLRFSFPSLVTDQSYGLVTLGLDYKHFTNVITEGGGSAPLVTPISYLNMSALYTGSFHTPHFEGLLTLNPNFGLRTAQGTALNFENDRFLSRPNYVYLRYDGSTTVHGPGDYRLTLRVAGQEANEPLISNENYSIGGIDGVRGYLEAEELGDTAIKASATLQTPNYSLKVSQLFNVFGFFDVGHMHLFDTLPGQENKAYLESWGLGLNILPTRAVTGSIVWADPLKNGTYTIARESRILFSVKGSF